MERASLTRKRLVDLDGLVVEDVRCESDRAGWSEPEESRGLGIVFVRRGSFRRRVRGRESLIDPTLAYFIRPGDEQQVAHHHDGGDACTAVTLTPEMVSDVTGLDELPGEPIAVEPALDLRHRLLLSWCRRTDALDIAEQTLRLIHAALAPIRPSPAHSCRPATLAARRRVVDDALAALSVDPSMGLGELARTVAVSPHHLSRIFREQTGRTLTEHRNRLRVRLAMERLTQGDRNLAAVASDLGFADHSHLARTIRRELGFTPSMLREILTALDGCAGRDSNSQPFDPY
jgi:AraC-like DNA-binding protein